MKRRVIELVSGQVVRDERQGGYQTQAVPVQKFDLVGASSASSVPSHLTTPLPAATRTPEPMPESALPAASGVSPIADIEATRYRPQRDLTDPPMSRPVRVGATGAAPLVPPPLNEPESDE
jgi:cell division transport system ATP-binding protein